LHRERVAQVPRSTVVDRTDDALRRIDAIEDDERLALRRLDRHRPGRALTRAQRRIVADGLHAVLERGVRGVHLLLVIAGHRRHLEVGLRLRDHRSDQGADHHDEHDDHGERHAVVTRAGGLPAVLEQARHGYTAVKVKVGLPAMSTHVEPLNRWIRTFRVPGCQLLLPTLLSMVPDHVVLAALAVSTTSSVFVPPTVISARSWSPHAAVVVIDRVYVPLTR
jgi:hypothetical protein